MSWPIGYPNSQCKGRKPPMPTFRFRRPRCWVHPQNDPVRRRGGRRCTDCRNSRGSSTRRETAEPPEEQTVAQTLSRFWPSFDATVCRDLQGLQDSSTRRETAEPPEEQTADCSPDLVQIMAQLRRHGLQGLQEQPECSSMRQETAEPPEEQTVAQTLSRFWRVFYFNLI